MLLIPNAEPLVAPLIEIRTMVEEDVIEEFVSVRVISNVAGIETDVKVALPDLPFTTTGDAAAPDAEGEVKRIPFPDVPAIKLPLVALTSVPATTDVVALR